MNFRPHILFDNGSFKGSHRSDPKEKLSDWPTKRRRSEKCLKLDRLKIADIKVRRHFQADLSKFRGFSVNILKILERFRDFFQLCDAYLPH